MARRILSKTKKILLMLDNIKDLLNFVVMIYVMMYIIATRHYRMHRVKSTRTRKRPRDADAQCLGDMANTLRCIVDVTKKHLETVKEVLLSDHATSAKRSKLVEEIQKIEGLNDLDVLDAAAAIIGDYSKIELLFSLPDNLKSEWIHTRLLNR